MKHKYTYFLLMALLVGITACKKTIDLEPLPQNKILEYKISNLKDTVMYAAINQLNNTITVYLPVFYGLSLIDPEIKVSEGATLTEVPMPVGVYEQDKKYTVKAADGSTNTYTLKIKVMNPVKLNAIWPANYLVNGEMISYPLNSTVFSGNFNAFGTGLIQVDLINKKSGKVIKVNDAEIAWRPGTIEQSAFFTPNATIDTGVYQLNLKYYDQDIIMKEPLHIVHRQPDLLMPSKNVKQGESISFPAFQSIFLGLKSVKVKLNDKDTYDLPVIGFTPLEMTLKVPDNFPVGIYDYTAYFTFEFENWKAVSKLGSLSVSAK
ncbi:hypothetical protein [Pedobacter gandavensis]|uniref:hypothetical protein n=1 Tax=Pedobacter gandavensis TaxID=2679963 RepID=UPI00292ED85A|nr:hypothetical protein [Pedobacter gandavensis]